MPHLVLTETEIEDAHQRRENVGHFFQTYRESIGHDPGDVVISHHLEWEGLQDTMFWINPGDHHIVDVLAHKGIRLIKATNVSRYHWIVALIVGTMSFLDTI